MNSDNRGRKTLMPDQERRCYRRSSTSLRKIRHKIYCPERSGNRLPTWISRKAQIDFGLTLGNRFFFNDRFGVMLAGLL
ncbi:hypothetical protein [Muribaculum gordoncarteri]|uniref:hypothetical protein n=1 Tax=Muribaculum gordoncarteri TaxID=2530390 RepID=UPI003F66A7DC